jgi:heparan-alpha-glucosaminide N-acetyltransferase
MNRESTAEMSPSGEAGHVGRVRSIDLIRGCDVLLMLFVNEVALVRGTPAFLLHKHADVDGMTMTDVVFPAFLFIVGMAIPFGLSRRLRGGQARTDVWRHVLARTFALLVIGVLMVNAEHASADGAPRAEAWNLLMTIGVVLVWGISATDVSARRRRGLRAVGIVLLIVLAFVYRSGDLAGPFQIRTYWWGILGLIGWAYLVVASLYLVVGDQSAILVGCIGLLYCVYLADEAGQWLSVLQPYLRVGRVLGSHAAVVLSGVVLGVMVMRNQQEGSPRRVVWRALGYAGGLAAGGLLLHTLHPIHPAFWVNKVLATAPWCLLCSAVTCGAWVLVFIPADVKGWQRWPKAVSLAGENALLAYLVAPFLLSAFDVSAHLFGRVNPYEALGHTTWVGMVRSAVFAWIVVRLCGMLRSFGILMQL